MQIKPKLIVRVAAFVMASLLLPPAYGAGASSETDTLVRGFPSLDELENHLGTQIQREGADDPQPRVQANSARTQGTVFPVSMRWFTSSPVTHTFRNSAPVPNAESADTPLASLFATMDASRKEAETLGREIGRQNNLAVNKYLLDRWSGYARTDYGTDITGLFVNGVGFGSVEQTFRQSYGLNYSVPLLQRYSGSTKWTRILSEWTFSASAGVMPLINPTLQLQQFLNNLQFSWSVSLNYNVHGAMLRKMQDHQYDKEAALGKAAMRAAASREELLKKMALRINALSTNRPVSDTRLTSLRELYPQFELYQARYQQGTSCDERMEDFFTLKGLALSLLTLADYDRPDEAGRNLLQTWKRARFAGCGKTL